MLTLLATAAVDEEIRAVAGMASLSLALLGIFTNFRRESLKGYLEVVKPFGKETVVGLLPDLGLAALTGWAVAAMAPLCFDSFHLADLGHRSGAVAAMFALIWFGFVIVLLVQLSFAGIRLVSALKAGSGNGG